MRSGEILGLGSFNQCLYCFREVLQLGRIDGARAGFGINNPDRLARDNDRNDGFRFHPRETSLVRATNPILPVDKWTLSHCPQVAPADAMRTA